MLKSKLYHKFGFRLVLSAFSAAVVSFSVEAQDGCSSFGWANYDGQTAKGPVTGGGNATITQVTTFAALKSAVESSDAKVIHIMNDMGNGYKDSKGDVLNFKSNKTVIGAKAGITIKCSFQIKGVSNVIVKNLIIKGPGSDNKQSWDAVTIQGSKRIWFDHCTVMDGQDGNFDVVKGSDNVTVSWCKFTYNTNGSHNLSNLIGSSDSEPISHDKLNVTYAYCWWDKVNSRCPRVRYGKIHVLNSYYSNVKSGVYAGFMSNIRVEGCYFESSVEKPTGLINTGGKAGVFTIDCNIEGTKKDGYDSAFVPPYQYKKYSDSEVKGLVTSKVGATLTSPTDCGGTASVSPKEMSKNTNGISFVPVNVSDYITVNLNVNHDDEITMSVLSLTGRKVAELRSVSNYTGNITKSLNLKSIQAGAYILKLSTSSQVIAQRIIKLARSGN